ncbi:PREDICTED: uncharacterized protein LOC106102366 isoform X2 [Papilio polytes]|nr:PREDICTED: uncharacterized protein LOC106102366 isoform X2 [Papilio polytes]
MRDLVQRGNTLQATLIVTNCNKEFQTKSSSVMTINGAAKFQVVLIVSCNQHIYYNLIFIRFYKVRKDDDLMYTITLSSSYLQIENKIFHADDGTWHLIKEIKARQYSFDINVVMNIVACSTFAALYDDEDLMDFELRGEDGAVRVHRAVLAACSPVLRRMLSGGWRETTEGHVDVPGTSMKTLQDFKSYIYKHILPDAGLEPILLLASYYMMPGLEQMCVNRLVGSLVAENACELLHFAAKHRLTRLLLAVLDYVQRGVISVDDIRKHSMRTTRPCDGAEAGVSSSTDIAAPASQCRSDVNPMAVPTSTDNV